MSGPLKEPHILSPQDSFLPQVTDYTSTILFFPNSGNGRDAIVQNLRDGFTRMMDAIPWITGSVTMINLGHQHGRLAITAPSKTVDDLLTVNILEYLDYTELKAQHFPTQAVIEIGDEVWPHSKWTEQPTLQAQINFIQGGIIFAVRAAHSVADADGLFIITKVWAAYCRGEDGSLLLGPDSLDRGRLMSAPPVKLRDDPLYKELPIRKQAPENRLARMFLKLREWVSTCTRTGLTYALRLVSDLITYRRIRVALRARKAVEEDVKQQLETVFFSNAKLQELKEAVTAVRNAQGQTESKAWSSTNDALVSLLWCCINQTWKESNYFDRDSNPDPLKRMKVQRQHRTTQPVSMVGFFVNARRLVQDPPLKSYIGNVVLMNYAAAPFNTISPTMDSVARQAYAVRRSVEACDESLLMRVFGVLCTVPDITRLKLHSSPFPVSYLLVNSWANIDYYSTDWGSAIGGRPERMRLGIIPNASFPFGVVMPKFDAKDGWSEDECGLEVTLRLRSADMRRLREDKFFNRFAEWR